ncbi:MAG TPA: L,D-transpeptidase family protein, partial [Pseudobdellovibrionaceae bacterium]|nr:L,D-transpeptidase family protein [Pseudobdellovibrionaceae bacterium]
MNFLGVIAGCVGRIVPSQNMQEVSFIRQWTFALVLLLSSFSSAGARETIAGFLQDKSVLRLTVGKEVFVFDTNDLAQIYGPRQFRPLWFDENGRMINRALYLKGAIGLAEEWALTSKEYWTPMIQSLFSQAQAQIGSGTAYPYWITVEFLLSDALLRFFRDIGTGKIAGSLVEEEFRVDLKRLRPEDFTNISNFLTNEGLDSKAFSEGWNQVAASVGPQHEIYLELLTAYRRIRKFDPTVWTSTALNLTLVEGVTHPSVSEIRHKLFVLGYLVKDNQSAQFDAEIVGVVRRLQEWNLLKVDGTISPAGETLRFLNIPLLSRLRQIEISLDKIRNMPNNWGSHFVFVNSAAAEISDWSASAQDGRSKFNYYMRGVVGRIERRTPTKRDFIREAILNPTWTVPRSLLRKDKINNLIKDPHWADSAGFRFYFDGEETSPSNIPWSID